MITLNWNWVINMTGICILLQEEKIGKKKPFYLPEEEQKAICREIKKGNIIFD
jgi:hypothetical protein